MPFQIVRNDLTRMRADAIVNATDAFYSASGGTDAKLHAAAGPRLAKACRRLPPLAPGEVAATRGFNLPCRYVIHTVGPVWLGGDRNELAELSACYTNALHLARRLGCKSVAFPLISSGTFGCPKDRVLRVALEAIGAFLIESEMMVFIVVYDKTSYSVSQRLIASIESFIDDHYVAVHTGPELFHSVSFADTSELFAQEPSPIAAEPEDLPPVSAAKPGSVPAPRPNAQPQVFDAAPQFQSPPLSAQGAPVFPKNMAVRQDELDRRLREIDESFSEMLLRRITESGMTDAECYKRANIDKRLFSKIRSNPHYQPSKPTALAFAVALRLSPAETRELLEKAGLALSRSSKFDIIIEYFLQNGIYDIFEINEVLYQFDQPCLGNFTA